MELVSFYKSLLETIGLGVDENDHVYLDHGIASTPYQINGKTLVLPTKEILLNPDWKNTIAFHPLSENIARKNSIVLQRLQRLTNLAINIHVGDIMRTMIEYCADTGSHSKLNHKQTAFLSCFPDADENALKNWDKILAALGESNQFVKLVTLRDKKLNGEFFSRVCFAKFPVYEACVEMMNNKPKEYTIFGIKVRKKDVHAIKALFEFIFKDIANPDEHYSCGTRSSVAPSFYVLAKTMYNLALAVQKVYRLLKLDYPDLGWGEQLDDLNKYKGLIPPLEGNEGELTDGERLRTELNIAPPPPAAKKSATTQKVNVISQNTPATAPVATNTLPTPTPVAQRVAPVTPQVAQQVTQAAQVSQVAQPTTTTVQAVAGQKREVNVISQVQSQQQVVQPQPQVMPAVVYGQPVQNTYPVDAYGRPIQQMGMVGQPMYQVGQPMMLQPQVDRNGRPINTGYHQQPIRVDNQPGYGVQPMQYAYNAYPGVYR